MLYVCAVVSASGNSPVSSSLYTLLRTEFSISAFSISVSATFLLYLKLPIFAFGIVLLFIYLQNAFWFFFTFLSYSLFKRLFSLSHVICSYIMLGSVFILVIM